MASARFSLLREKFGSTKKAYFASQAELKEIVDEKLANEFVSFRNRFDPEKEYQKIKESGIRVVCVDQEDYPPLLKKISDPPICLYLKGKLDLKFLADSPSIAIVGTRKPTANGIKLAKKFSFKLAETA